MRVLAGLVLVVAAGCGEMPVPASDAGSHDAAPAIDAVASPDGGVACTFGAVDTLPAFADGRLTEVSGIVLSRRAPGVRYVHNDSGESVARFFAVLPDGTTLAEIVIDGAPTPRDWEDVAIETSSDGREILTFGDVGDNAAREGGTPRSSVSVIRVEPPALPATPSATALHADVLSVTTLVYPDAPHDCEAILVEPETGDLYLLTKENAGASHVYRAAAPLLDGETRTLEAVRDVFAGDQLLTAADADARFVVVRNYSRAWVFTRGGRSIADTLADVPVRLPAVSEPQGEAVGLAADGVYFASEGAGTALHFISIECAP